MLIPAGSISDGWAFVGANRRLGRITRVGPVTGTTWCISTTGTWINEEDAYAFFDQIEQVWCFRSNGPVDINPVVALTPSIDQFSQKPSN